MSPLHKVLFSLFAIITVILMYQAIREPKVPEITHEEIESQECKGEPIVVNYAYEWTVSGPHACAVQCQDGKPRYIFYTNGLATQCEELPGCNDTGEDAGVTCIPPADEKASST